MSYYYQPLKTGDKDKQKHETMRDGQPPRKQKKEYVPDEIRPELKKLKLRDW